MNDNLWVSVIFVKHWKGKQMGLSSMTCDLILYFTSTDWFPCLIHCRIKWVESCWGNLRQEIDGRNYGSCLQTSVCFSTRRTRFVFMQLANAENSWLSTSSGNFIFSAIIYGFVFAAKWSANYKRDYICMMKLVCVTVVPCSDKWSQNEICRLLFWYFRNICDSCLRAVWCCRQNPCDFFDFCLAAEVCVRFQSWT